MCRNDLQLPQRLFKIGDQIPNKLNPHRDAQQIIRTPWRSPFSSSPVVAFGTSAPELQAAEHAMTQELEEMKKRAARLRDIFALPFIGDQTFDFATSTIHDDVIKQVPGALKRIESFQPPSDLVFIDRAIAGHYGNLRKVGARGRFLAMLRPYLYAQPA